MSARRCWRGIVDSHNLLLSQLFPCQAGPIVVKLLRSLSLVSIQERQLGKRRSLATFEFQGQLCR